MGRYKPVGGQLGATEGAGLGFTPTYASVPPFKPRPWRRGVAVWSSPSEPEQAVPLRLLPVPPPHVQDDAGPGHANREGLAQHGPQVWGSVWQQHPGPCGTQWGHRSICPHFPAVHLLRPPGTRVVGSCAGGALRMRFVLLRASTSRSYTARGFVCFCVFDGRFLRGI